MTIEKLEPQHWEAVKAIYEKGIATGNATFETTAPSWKVWDEHHLTHSRLICKIDGKIAGWVAISSVSEKCVYEGVAEISIYMDNEFQGMGIGLVLMQHLIKESEMNGIWTLQAGIFEENKASLRLHQKAGFRKVGYREQLGKLRNKWRNVVLFEKRSKVVGV